MTQITDLLATIDLNSLITIFDVQIALAIVVLAFIFKGIFAKFVIKIVYIITKNKKADPKDSAMYSALKKMFLIIGIYSAICIIPKTKQVKYYADKVFEIVIILFITKFITSIINKDSKYFKRLINKSENETVNEFMCKLIRGLVWIVSIFVIMSELGFDLSGLVTGLGIGSAAIVLAAQELVKNLLSGVSILTDRPFVLGDWIEVGDYAGTVVDITFRSTRIKTINNTLITIPNATITSTYVINWNRLKSRRLDLVLGLELSTTTEKIRKIVKQIKLVLANNPHVIEDTIQVHFSEIGSCSSDIKMFMYINETDYIKFLGAKQEILCDLLSLIEKENIELAYPTSTVYVRNSEGEVESK